MGGNRDSRLTNNQFVLVLSLAIVMAVVVISVFVIESTDGSTQFEEGGLTYEINDKGTASVISSDDRSAITVPAEIAYDGKTYRVTAIGDNAFFKCVSAHSISLPDSIERIGETAFKGCRSLTSMTIPSSTNYVSPTAFQWCYALASITVSSGNQYYVSVDGVLYTKDNLTLVKYPAGKTGEEFTVPDSVEKLEKMAFAGNTNLKKVVASGVTTIGDYSFAGCINITSIKLGVRASSIGTGALLMCKSVESFDIPANVRVIRDMAFNGCNNLRSINVDSSNNYFCSIDGVLYTKDKTELCLYPAMKDDVTDLSIPDGVKTFSRSAFMNNKTIVSVTFPSSVKSIDSALFFGCSSLREFKVDEGNSNFSSIDGVLYSKDKTHLIKCPVAKTCDDAFTIPEGVTTIGSSAFYGCSYLGSIHLSKDVQYIREAAFFRCFVGSYSVDQNNPYFCSVDGVLYDKMMSILYHYPALKTDSTFKVPSSVVRFGSLSDPIVASSGLSYNTYLTSIDVDDGNELYKSVDGILYSKDGSKLLICPAGRTQVTVPSGTQTIAKGAFISTVLQNLTLPDNVTLEEYALINCSSLSKIVVGGNGVVFSDYSMDFLDITKHQVINVVAPNGYRIPPTAYVGNVEFTYSGGSNDDSSTIWLAAIIVIALIVLAAIPLFAFYRERRNV